MVSVGIILDSVSHDMKIGNSLCKVILFLVWQMSPSRSFGLVSLLGTRSQIP